MVKVRTYGALMGALLTIAGVESAEAADCNCIPISPKHATVRPAPHVVHRARDEGKAYAQSWYDYHSAGRVTEEFVRHAPSIHPMAPPPVVRDDGFRVAPNDARIRFYRDEKVIYVPTVAYPPPPHAYYPPHPPAAYYPPPPPPTYYGPAPAYGEFDQSYFSGGVGYGADAGGGGGGGLGGVVTFANGGGADVPPNGGGVVLPPGFGPGFMDGFQGQPVPTRGGLVGH